MIKIFYQKIFLYSKALQTLCFAAILFSAVSVVGKNLSDYRKNIDSALDSVDQLLDPEGEALETVKDYLDFEKRMLANIRNSIPPTEKIEWENSSVETDNKWLAEKLDLYQKTAQDSPDRETILEEIILRLDAIKSATAELEKSEFADRSKDEDKRKLAEILRREEYKTAEAKDNSLFKQISDQIAKWFAEWFPASQINPASNTDFGSLASVLVYGLLALILAGIGFLVYKFAPQFIRNFRSREKKEKSVRVVLGETIAADQSASDLLREAESLAGAGNLRDAIRKGYIALLCELSDRKIIGLSQHKTNRDYLRDVRNKGELHQNMSGLTLNFERHWYGFEAAKQDDWDEFKTGYEKAVSSSQ